MVCRGSWGISVGSSAREVQSNGQVVAQEPWTSHSSHIGTQPGGLFDTCSGFPPSISGSGHGWCQAPPAIASWRWDYPQP
eukprot:1319866-Amorphochlora_amoeboformis.AAC.3